MRNTAYRLTAFTAIISAAGFLLRWLQNMKIYDAETGLAQSGMPISIVLTAVIVLTAAVFAFFALRLKRFNAPTDPAEALGGQTFLFTAAWAAAVLLLAVSGVLQLLSANAETYTQMQIALHRLTGVSALLAAAALAVLVSGLQNKEKAGARRWCAGILILFSGIWLSATYKLTASDPVLWRSAVEILAICATMMAFYHVAGYFFFEPSPMQGLFFCQLGAFLCIMSAIDEHTVGESLCFAAAALIQLIFSYTIIANLRPREEPLQEAIKE